MLTVMWLSQAECLRRLSSPHGITALPFETNSFLSAAPSRNNRVLTDVANCGAKTTCRPQGNVIIGKIHPSHTGMARYRNLEPQAINEVEIIDEVRKQQRLKKLETSVES